MTSVYFDPAVGGDGTTVSDDSNPSTGLANGGYQTRLVPCFVNVVAMAGNAKTSATNAAASATSANSAWTNVQGAGSISALVNGTSVTSLTVGTGSKTLTTQSGKSWVVGSRVRISDSTTGTNNMDGSVTAYSGTSLTVSVDRIEGTGTLATWNISYVGPTGPATLVNLTESVSATGINATVPAVRLLATNAATNADLVLSSKGTGSILADLPDATATGGNKRGINVVDLQMSRAVAAQVASGDSSVIAGGQNNKATATWSTVSGGSGGVASGLYSVVMGGQNNTASGQYAVTAGGNNTADGYASTVLGAQGAARAIAGNFVFGGAGHNAGKNQAARIVVGWDNTLSQFTLRTDIGGNTGSSVSANSQVTLPNNSTYYCTFKVVAFDTVNIAAASWTGSALIRRGLNAGTTAIVSTPIVSNDFMDAGMVGTTLTVSADTTIGCLKFGIANPGGLTVAWTGTVDTVEVTA